VYTETTVRVLVIDDDSRLFELLESYLMDNGVQAQHALDGRRGLEALERGAFDAVLLDVMMPGLDGLAVLRKIRERSAVPVLMLTAKGDETDRVVGLELGADDYLAKPFSPRELLARLRAVLRRAQPREEGAERLAARNVVVDVPGRTASVDGEAVELTGLELDLLIALMRRAGRVVQRARLLAEAGRSDVTVSERTVDVHVSNLRKKLGDRDRDPPLIRSVRGVGYVLAKDT
jgi:two-component system OmpR family response regulator